MLEEKKARFSSAVSSQLIKAGWYEGRDVGMQHFPGSRRPLHSAAASILKEFGGLEIDCIDKPLRRKKRSWNPFAEVIWESTYEDVAGHLGIKYENDSEKSKLLSDAAGGNWVCLGDLDCDGPILVNEQAMVVLGLNNLHFWASNWDSFLERILTGERREPPPEELQPGFWPLPD